MANPRQQLSPFTYRRSGVKKEWQPVAPSAPPHPSKPLSTKRPLLTVATLNIWFDGLFAEVRYPAILDLITSMKADVICLQEVHSGFIDVLRAHKGVRDRFGYMGGAEGGAGLPEVTWYGCLILFDKTTVIPSDIRCTHSRTSVQGRHLLSARFAGIDKKHTEGLVGFAVGTSHVESPVTGNRNPAERQRQLQDAKVLLSEGGYGAIFCGDTNVSPEDEAEFPPVMEWFKTRDLWLGAGGSADTMTFGMTYPVKEPPKRLDRLFMIDDSVPYEVVKAELFGADKIYPKGEKYEGSNVYLSDHIGVYATVRLGAAA